MDAGKVTALTFLGLSVTFDIIDRPILLRRLDDWLGVTRKGLLVWKMSEDLTR